MTAYNEFNKALRYLDFGKMELGENSLKKAIEIAESQNDNNMKVQLYCCYGEYLIFVNRKLEASKFLKKLKN